MPGVLLAIRTRSGGGGVVGGPLTATVAAVVLTGFSYGYGYVYTSGAAEVIVTGGTPPYSFNWTYVSGSAAIEPTADTSATSSFRANLAGTTASAVWKCVVTDAASTVVNSNNVTITLESVTFPSGGVIP